jgi:acetylornithine/succinyldiaminopimelate/putrescine aminotransferase
MEVIMREDLSSKATAKEKQFREELSHLPVKEIRGEGLLLAVVPEERKIVPEIVRQAPAYGLLLDYFLFCDDAFRIAPPLTITPDEIHIACQRLKALTQALS